MAARNVLGADQVETFKTRFCRIATPEEVAAADFDIGEVLPDEKFYRLEVVPSRVFRIPGFSRAYSIKCQWRQGQIIHPWLL